MEYKGTWHILVYNLSTPDQGLPLGSGLWVKPIKTKLNIFNMAALGSLGFKEWAVLEPFLPNCFSEIVSAKDADTIPGYDTLNRAWLSLTLLCLRGYTKQLGLACSSISWSEAEKIRESVSGVFIKNGILGESDPSQAESVIKFQGGLLDFHIDIISTKHAKERLEKSDSVWIDENFERFNKLAASNEAFRFALSACVDWRYLKDIRAAISRIWSGIESILELKIETVYRLSIIAASLISPRGEQRLSKYKSIKKLYNIRSKAVHGGELKENLLTTALEDSFSLLSSILLICVEQGKMLNVDDFEKAVLT